MTNNKDSELKIRCTPEEKNRIYETSQIGRKKPVGIYARNAPEGKSCGSSRSSRKCSKSGLNCSISTPTDLPISATL
jgi:hypothetical protein